MVYSNAGYVGAACSITFTPCSLISCAGVGCCEGVCMCVCVGFYACCVRCLQGDPMLAGAKWLFFVLFCFFAF